MSYLSKGDRITSAEQDLIDIIGTLGAALTVLRVNAAGTSIEWAASGSGTVTTVSVVSANGVSGSVATATTTPAITLTLGIITPTSVNGLTLASQAIGFTIAGGTTSKTLTVPLDATVSGTNTGDQTTVSGNAGTVTIGNEATDTTCFPLFATDATGSLSPKTVATFTFNSNTSALTATTFIGALSGNATTATDTALKTGTGSTYATSVSPVFTTPTLGVASATSLATSAATPLLLTNGQLVNIALTSQTVGATTLTIPDFASVVDEFTFKTKAQTMANKTLTTPVINGLPTGTGVATANTVSTLVARDASGNFAAGTITATLTGTASGNLVSGGALGTPSSGTGTNITGIPAANILAGSFGAGAFVISTSLQSATIELGHATDTTLARVSAGVVSIEGITIDTISATNTLTNKRIEPRIVSAASYTTDTGTSLDVSTTDIFVITAQAGALLFNSPGGTPVQGQKLIIRIKDNATARALTWNAVFRAMGTALPSTTVLSKTLYLGFFYNSTDTKWDLVASAQEA